MADTGHERTNDIIEEMTKQIEKEYEKAAKAVEKKLNAYLKSFDQKEEEQLKLLDAGKITEQQFNRWRETQLLTGQRWQDLLEQLTGDMVNANDIARSTIRGHMADVYTLNRNYAAYQVEQDAHIDTSWTLYNRRATENLFKNNDNLLPMPKPGSRAWQQMQNEDTRWNQQKINSSMIQGILQGDGIRELSGRLMHVVGMNENSAVRNARTMTTYVQNKARDDTFAELAEKGVEMEQQWVATLDDRTRSTHRWLHGEVRSEEGTYSNGLRFPGDPMGDPEEVYNCRCTEISHVKGFPIEIPKTLPEGMDFDDWLGEKPERLENRESPVEVTKEPDPNVLYIEKMMAADKIVPLEPGKLDRELSSDEIIRKVAGGDKTKGSCVSLAWTYAGNRGGLDMRDFRGGRCCACFSRDSTTMKILDIAGVRSKTEKGVNDIKCAYSLMETIAKDDHREYILGTGKHTAVIRRNAEGLFEYLEMQSGKQNGFMPFTKTTLKDRFGCKRSHTFYGQKIEYFNYLVEMDSLIDNDDFKSILKYINTAESDQMKGDGGFEK